MKRSLRYLAPILLYLVFGWSTSCSKFSFSNNTPSAATGATNSTGLQFTGLAQADVTLSPDLTTISLTWPMATHNVGQVTYTVFGSDTPPTSPTSFFENPGFEYDTTLPQFTYTAITIGHIYYMGVRARDSLGSETNTSIVPITVSNGKDMTPPTFNGLVSAVTASDTKIVLHWQASPSSNLAYYVVYNAYDIQSGNPNPPVVATTIYTEYTVQGLQPNSQYSYIARAVSQNAIQDANTVAKSAVTLAYTVPDFLGALTCQRVGGVAGMSELTVTWSAAVGTVAGYDVYRGTTSGGEDFTTPVATLASSAVTFTESNGALLSGATYYYVVRAYYLDSNSNKVEDVNTWEVSNSTLSLTPPTFAGVTSATALAGSAGFNAVTVDWGTPQLNGVWNTFEVQYEPGTCAQGFSANPQTLLAPVNGSSYSLASQEVDSLTTDTAYRVRVYAMYVEGSTTMQDNNTACVNVTTTPPSATFGGIQTLALQPGLPAGFTAVQVGFNPVSAGSWTYYQIDLATDTAFQNLVPGVSPQFDDIEGIPGTPISVPVSGLAPNTKYYVRVSAVFNDTVHSLPPVGLGNFLGAGGYLAITTTPVSPSTEGLATSTATPPGVQVSSATSLTVTWNAPAANDPGVLDYNGFRVYAICANYTADPTIQTNVQSLTTNANGYVPKAGETLYISDPFYTGSASSTVVFPNSATSSSTGFASASGQTQYQYTYTNLTQGNMCCFQVRAYYNSPPYMLGSNSVADPQCGTPQLVAPAFNGITAVSIPQDGTGFSSANVTFNPILAVQSGLFTRYEIAAFTTNANPGTNWNPSNGGTAAAFTTSSTAFNNSAPTAPVTVQLTGLNSNTLYYFRVQAVNANTSNASEYAYAGESAAPIAKTTTPTPPSGDSIPKSGGGVSAGPQSIQITYNGPPATGATVAGGVEGLYNNVIFYVAEGDNSAASSVQMAAIAAGGAVYTNNMLELPGSNAITLSAPPIAPAGAVIYAPLTNTSPAAPASMQFNISGLSAGNQPVTVIAYAVYYDGNPQHFLQSTTPTFVTVTPQSSAPLGFTGGLTRTMYSNASDFNTLNFSWSGPTSDLTACTLDVSIVCVPGSGSGNCTSQVTGNVNSPAVTGPTQFDYSNPSYINLPCTQTSLVATGLQANVNYYVQVRAKNCYTSGGITTCLYAPSTAQPPTATEVNTTMLTTPAAPSGESIAGLTPLAIVEAPDQITMTYNPASVGYFDHLYVWRATSGVAAQAASVTNGSGTGPVGVPYAILSMPTGTTGVQTWVDTNVPDGITEYYVIKSVASNGYLGGGGAFTLPGTNPYYLANGVTPTAVSATTTYNTMNSIGVVSGSILGYWPDGTAQIGLNFPGNIAPTGDVEYYYVYYTQGSGGNGFGSTSSAIAAKVAGMQPTLIINHANSADPTHVYDLGGSLELPDLGTTLSGEGDYVVRCVHSNGPVTNYDLNTSVATLVVPPSAAHYAYVPKSVSQLSYDYYIMTNEASIAAGTSFTDGGVSGATSITTNTTSLNTCNASWISSASAGTTPPVIDASCFSSGSGTNPPSAKAVSAKAVTPASADFAQAWMACRQASGSSLAVRLPTEEEWRRAARIAGSPGTADLSSQWTKWQSYCDTNSAEARNAGASSSCGTNIGALDMVGNMREWVDRRTSGYTPSARFGYSPSNLQKVLPNGLDNQGSNTTWLIHELSSSANGLGLLLGSDFRQKTTANFNYPGLDNSGSPTAIDAQIESWEDVAHSDSSTGFRCVAFLAGNIPSAAQMALPNEPGYSSTDTIPDNLYQNDRRPETLTLVTSYSGSSWSGTSVSLKWQPWTKTVAGTTSGNTSTDFFTYYVYRMIEPNYLDQRGAITWAINPNSDGTSPYTAATPLDPFAMSSVSNTGLAGSPIWATPTGNMVINYNASCDGVSVTNCCSTSQCYFKEVPGQNAYRGASTVNSMYSPYTFDPTMSYYYLIVAKDVDGNSMPAMVQRYRSPTWAGDTSKSYATATFRSEVRFRRASPWLANEAFQTANSINQTSVYVPLDQSGADHDFFEYRYPASIALAGVVDGSNQQSPDSGPENGQNWYPGQALCYETLHESHGFSAICAQGMSVSGYLDKTSETFQSVGGATIASSVSTMMEAFHGCANSVTSVDESHPIYIPHAPSNSEWFKAADPGDLTRNGIITSGANPDSTIWGANVYTTLYNTGGYCDYSTAGGVIPLSSATHCISRYGGVVNVGMVGEWTGAQGYNGIGADDGIEGLITGMVLPTPNDAYDLLRGIVASTDFGVAGLTEGTWVYIAPSSTGYTTFVRGAAAGASFGASRYVETTFVGYSSFSTRCAY